MRLSPLRVAVPALLAVGPLRSLHGQVAPRPDSGHRVVTVGLGFFVPQGVGLLTERFFLDDRFSAVVVVAAPFCADCSEAPAFDVGGGLRAFGNIPPVPYLLPGGLSRVFVELYAGPLALRKSPFRLYNGIGVAFGIEGGDPKTGLSVGASVGGGWFFKKGTCTDFSDLCPPIVASAYLAWTVWR